MTLKLLSRLLILLTVWLGRYLFSLLYDAVNKPCRLSSTILFSYSVDVLNYAVQQLIDDAVLSHTWLDNGTYTVAVRVTDDDGSADTATLTVSVNNVAPSVNAGPDQTADEGKQLSFIGSFTDPGALDTHTYLWDFGDGSTSTELSTTHTFADNGIYTITLTVTDKDGGVGTDTLTVTVNNVAPTVNAGVDQTADEGEQLNFVGSFTDPGI